MQNKIYTVLPRPFIIMAISLFSFFTTSAQNIDGAIANYADQYAPERMYLHYDKPVYAPGETIWFKAYLMTEVIPADQSKTLYVDWIDDKGKLLKHVVCPLVEAVTNGQFDIPLNYKGNTLQVKAYTRWMLNFDSAFLYTKTFSVLNNEKKSTGVNEAIVPSIHFFPEGGDAVAGFATKVAFKATNQWGKPVAVNGFIINSNGSIEDTIRTLHDGMGFITITPKTGVTYTAQWKAADGVQHTTSLPAVKPSGIALQIGLQDNKRSFTVNFSPEIAAATDSLHIVGTMYQRQAFRISKSISTTAIKGTIPTESLPDGILTITIFDKNRNALAERITYVNNYSYVSEPLLEIKKKDLKSRALNEIKISVPDEIDTKLSVAVTDAYVDTDSSHNIISHLMLSSELKGNINNPAYYFSANNAMVKQHLDLVMLTNGWRKFAWKEVFKPSPSISAFKRDTSFITLSGTVIGVKKGKAISDGATTSLVVSQKDGPGKIVTLPIRPDGTFNDPDLIIFDTIQVYYQFQKGKELLYSTIQFMTDQLPGSAFNSFPYTDSFWIATPGSNRQLSLTNEANSIAELMRMKTLENVIVKSTKTPKQILDETYTSGLFRGGDAIQLDLREDPFADNVANIFYYLQGRVAGLNVFPSASPEETVLTWRGDSPLLFVDGMPADKRLVSTVNVRDIAYIKAIRPPAVGFNAMGGVIAIYSKRGDDFKTQKSRDGFVDNKVVGYTQIRQFYSPDYSTVQSDTDRKDLRTTLYWNPAVVTTEKQKDVTLSFYNNDVSNALRVVIEGMTAEGKLIHVEKILK